MLYIKFSSLFYNSFNYSVTSPIFSFITSGWGKSLELVLSFSITRLATSSSKLIYLIYGFGENLCYDDGVVNVVYAKLLWWFILVDLCGDEYYVAVETYGIYCETCY